MTKDDKTIQRAQRALARRRWGLRYNARYEKAVAKAMSLLGAITTKAKVKANAAHAAAGGKARWKHYERGPDGKMRRKAGAPGNGSPRSQARL